MSSDPAPNADLETLDRVRAHAEETGAGCGYVLVEREPAYVAIARARLAHAERQGRFF